MASLSSMRPGLTQVLYKRQLSAYLSSATRLAHSAASGSVASAPLARRSRRKRTVQAEALKPSDAAPKSPYYGKLQPHDLSKRLRVLTEKGDIEAAVTMLKSMPLAAQNVKVWNTVIKAAFDAEKFKLAFSLYTDMKRRGFKPSLRTYTTMMSGYHRTRSWEGLEIQLQNLHSVYQSFSDYLEAVPDSLDSSDTSHAVRTAVTQYLDVCYNARQSMNLQDAFEQLPRHGPLARDGRMYAAYLRDLLRQELPPAELAARVREIWEELQEIRAKDSSIDPRTNSFLVDLVFRGLTQSPNFADHSLAFDIVRNVFVLHPEGKLPGSATRAVPMPFPMVVHILRTANLLGRPDFVLDFAKVLSRREDLLSALNMPIVHQVLSATREVSRRDNAKLLSDLVQVIAAQRPQQLDKAPLTVQGIFKACLDCSDFAAAKIVLSAVLRLRTSELATAGHVYHAKTITTTSWSYFVRAALYGNASDARLATMVLEKQAGHLVEDVVSKQPLKGVFRATLAQTMVQVAERADKSFTPSWYNTLRSKVDAYTSAQQQLDGSTALPPDDPFAPGALVDAGLEIDALELTEDMADLDLLDTSIAAQGIMSSNQ